MESPYPYENEDPEDEKSEVEGETLGLRSSDTWFGIANSTGQSSIIHNGIGSRDVLRTK